MIAWGATLALMNCCFYEAIDRLPLGTVAAIEFVPVIALAALGARSVRNALALGLAIGGVALLSDVQLSGAPLGFAFAAANAVLFALYVVLAHRASRDQGVGRARRPRWCRARVSSRRSAAGRCCRRSVTRSYWLAGVGVGICSSVIPYVTDQLAMARLPRATYALMVALLPAIAVVIGAVVLAQLPSPAELAAVGLVIAGVAIHRDASYARR